VNEKHFGALKNIYDFCPIPFGFASVKRRFHSRSESNILRRRLFFRLVQSTEATSERAEAAAEHYPFSLDSAVSVR
jgi:hypothetical protein